MRLIICCLTILLLSVSGSAAWAKKSRSQPSTERDTPSHIQIPVFFVTDRNVEQTSPTMDFGVKRQHLGHCPHDPNMGVTNFTIDNSRHREITEQDRTLGWTEADRAKEGQYETNAFSPDDYAKRETELNSAIVKAAAKTPDKEVYLFVPGYMSTFRSGAESAARIAYFSHHPVVLFSWASRGSGKLYSADEATIEWCQPHFARMVDQLLTVCGQDGVKVRIYAHSMGNRLLLRAMPKLRGNPNLREIAFCCPDLDAGVTLHYIDDYAEPESKISARLYTSAKDKALRLSQFVHGGYARFGQEKGYAMLLPEATGAPNAEVAKRRLDSVDYTAIDAGRVGHKIPVALMCQMSADGKCPPGLTMVKIPPQTAALEAKQDDATKVAAAPVVSPNAPTHYVVGLDKSDKENARYYKSARAVGQTILRKDWTLK